MINDGVKLDITHPKNMDITGVNFPDCSERLSIQIGEKWDAFMEGKLWLILVRAFLIEKKKKMHKTSLNLDNQWITLAKEENVLHSWNLMMR